MSSEVINFPYYDGLTNVDNFLDAFEREILEDYHFQALDKELRITPTQWWGMNKDKFDEWLGYRKMMRTWFSWPKVWVTKKYDGRNDSHDHLAKWTKVYGIEPQPNGCIYFVTLWT